MSEGHAEETAAKRRRGTYRGARGRASGAASRAEEDVAEIALDPQAGEGAPDVPEEEAREQRIGRSGNIRIGQLSPLAQQSMQRFPRLRFCELCGPVKAAASHKKIQGPHHKYRFMTATEWEDFARAEPALVERGQGHPQDDYHIDFGRNDGRMLSEVLRDDPGWVQWLVEDGSHLFENRPSLRRALFALGCLENDNGVDGPGPCCPRVRAARRQELRQVHHCAVCGSTDHNILTCPSASAEDLRTAIRVLMTPEQRCLRSHRYTQDTQRDPLSHPLRQSDVPRSARALNRPRSFLELARAGRREFLEMAYADGALTNLSGCACFNDSCSGALGELWVSDAPGFKINRATAYHACRVCRRRYLPTHGNALFARCRGAGSLPIDETLLIHWLKSHAFSLAKSQMVVGRIKKTCQNIFHLGMAAKYYDILARQSLMVFGGKSFVVDCEADEKLFGATAFLDTNGTIAPTAPIGGKGRSKGYADLSRALNCSVDPPAADAIVVEKALADAGAAGVDTLAPLDVSGVLPELGSCGLRDECEDSFGARTPEFAGDTDRPISPELGSCGLLDKCEDLFGACTPALAADTDGRISPFSLVGANYSLAAHFGSDVDPDEIDDRCTEGTLGSIAEIEDAECPSAPCEGPDVDVATAMPATYVVDAASPDANFAEVFSPVHVDGGCEPSESAFTSAAAARPQLLWFGLPYVLFAERGDVPGPYGRRKVWVSSMGYCMSRTLKRLPRMTGTFWRQCLSLIRLADDANVALHTDGGESTRRNAYANVKHPGFVQHETTKHSLKQYARACILPGRRHGITGDQLAECLWSKLSPFTRKLPPRDDVGMELGVREGQWHTVIGVDADAWRLYCRAGTLLSGRLADDVRDDHFSPLGFPTHAAAAAKALRAGDDRPLPVRVRERLLKVLAPRRSAPRRPRDGEADTGSENGSSAEASWCAAHLH